MSVDLWQLEVHGKELEGDYQECSARQDPCPSSLEEGPCVISQDGHISPIAIDHFPGENAVTCTPAIGAVLFALPAFLAWLGYGFGLSPSQCEQGMFGQSLPRWCKAERMAPAGPPSWYLHHKGKESPEGAAPFGAFLMS